jgi:formate dehydrogenase iron-sulfur subunit
MAEKKTSRKKFLKAAGASLLAAPFVLSGIVKASEDSSEVELGKPKGILMDVRRCIGCKACQTACKAWNKLAAEKTELNEGEFTNPPNFSPETWKVVRFKEIGSYDSSVAGTGGLKWRMVSDQCRHCLDPYCVSVCPTGALWKRKDGPVLFDVNRCVGCYYCMMACPWKIPQFDEKIKAITKCTFCFDRQDAGMEPACVSTCPTDALEFGDLDKILEKAKDAVDNESAYIHGRDEAGGTSLIFISDVPFAELGISEVGSEAPGTFNMGQLTNVSIIGIVGAVAVGGLWMYTRRRASVEGTQEDD